MKLHIGGEQKKEGWKILNIQKKPNVDFVGDITDLSQFKDNSINEIYASHVFEHIVHKKVIKTLKGIHRVLKNSGKFYISVPNMDYLFRIILNEKAPLEVKMHVMKIIFGGQIDDYDFHYFGYTLELLGGALKECGFNKIERVKSFSLFNDTSDYAPYGKPISLNLIAYK
tara:strand:+ start:96 stop:605 length:510 start_codon:yes stop_codon:yes gene_type:complete